MNKNPEQFTTDDNFTLATAERRHGTQLRGSRLQRTGIALSTLILAAACTASYPEAGSDTPLAVGNPAQLGRAVLLKGSFHTAVSQYGPETFDSYIDASGIGPTIKPGDAITVDCYVIGPVEAAPSAKGKWYHIIGPPQLAGDFAATNTFYNQEKPELPDENNAVDPRIPACPDNIG